MASSDVQQNATPPKPFPWTGRSTEAALLVAEDVLTDQAIADQLGINRATLHRWKQHPDFAAAVARNYDVLQSRALRRGLARLDVRMRRYDRRADALDRIVAERAADPSMQTVPGGTSGYLARQLKSITVTVEGSEGDDGDDTGPSTVRQYIEEFHFDAALDKAQRELEKQAAIEAGQWNEKREVSGSISITIAGVDTEKL